MTPAAARVGLALAAILSIGSVLTGCQRALVCDISVFAVTTTDIAPSGALPPDAEMILDSGDFDASQATIGPTDQGVEVRLQLQPEPAERFRAYTADNLGGSMAVTLNDSVVSTPMIQSEIPDGAISLSLAAGDAESDAFASCIQRRALPEP